MNREAMNEPMLGACINILLEFSIKGDQYKEKCQKKLDAGELNKPYEKNITFPFFVSSGYSTTLLDRSIHILLFLRPMVTVRYYVHDQTVAQQFI